MLTTLVAVLSLASSVTLDVPFLPQTDTLCGGAAAAMVFRYWGDTHADMTEFAALVDRRRRGIADDVLVDAVERRGWRALRVNGSIEELEARLRDRQPVIVLIEERRGTYHYVVVTGVSAHRILVHDPSRGPSRAIDEEEFLRKWKATRHWSLVVLPPTDGIHAVEQSSVTRRTTAPDDARCDALIDAALEGSAHRDLRDTEAVLNDVRAQCRSSASALRELAGVRFAQQRWHDAAEFARRALALDGSDAYAWDMLGSSLFMQDDAAGALRAWNRIGKPRVDLVKIDGLQRARYQAMSDVLGIRPNALLTAEAFERARRRLDDLPDRANGRLAFRPQADGYARVDVVVSERSMSPRSAAEWTAAAARSAIDREVVVSLPGFTGQGELWTASWRWWNERPRVAMSFATPHSGRLPGVWRVDASWEAQTYAFDTDRGAPSILRESRAHGGLTISDWINGGLRYSAGAGVDGWNSDQTAAFVSGSVEQRLLNDRLSLSMSTTAWPSLGQSHDVTSSGVRTRFHSSPQFQSWIYHATAGAERVSDSAPFALWPGAGDGHAREPLLRAHPLLLDGIVTSTPQTAFGRTLTYANIELQRWLERPLLPHLGLAGFVDVARSTRRVNDSSGRAQVDAGGGLRIRIPGAEGILRIDIAHGVHDGANALTFGWQY